MKKFLISFALLTMTQIASAKTIAKTAITLENKNFSKGIVEVATLRLDDSGVLNIVVQQMNGMQLGTTIISEDTIVLKKRVYNQLKNLAASLSNQEIETRQDRVVCMMMPMPGANPSLFVAKNYDYQTGSFNGELRTVLGQNACWNPTKIFPKDQYSHDVAKELRAQLALLGMQFAE